MTKETISSDGFPWAIAVYENKEVNIPLLKNMGASTTEKVIGSVQHFEYSIAEALNKITKAKTKNCCNQRKRSCKIF
jgi:hypothetical protein